MFERDKLTWGYSHVFNLFSTARTCAGIPVALMQKYFYVTSVITLEISSAAEMYLCNYIYFA